MATTIWLPGIASVAGEYLIPADVTVYKREDGLGFATPRGLTLYVNELTRETPLACSRQCAELWKPFAASNNAQPIGDWTLVSRPDGIKQWAYKAEPLFTSILDVEPGTVNGDGDQIIKGSTSGSWRVAYEPMVTPPGITVQATSSVRMIAGIMADPSIPVRTLADDGGMTLYTFDGDVAARAPKCVGTCLTDWRPLAAPLRAVFTGEWSIVRREDGTRQWSYRGKPLYRYLKDARPGDKDGDGANNNMWHAAVVTPALPHWPVGITVQNSPMGPVFADSEGTTLYAYHDTPDKLKIKCNDRCMQANWRAAIAPADAKANGMWSVIARDDGKKQWVFRGRPLYTYAFDKNPGDVSGDLYGYGGDLSEGIWKPIVITPPS